jgi:hypothetical protein
LGSVRQNNSADALASRGNCLHRLMLVDDHAGFFRSLSQRQRERSVVYLMVFGTEHRSGELAREMRLAPAHFRGRDPLHGQAELVLKRKVMLQARLIVGSQSNDERSLRTQLDVHSGACPQFLGKGGPARLTFASEGDKRLFSRFRLRAGGEHAGGSVAGALPCSSAVENGDT